MKSTKSSSQVKTLDLSVVIPAYNEEKHIRACLDSLVAQKTKHCFEVIVADNNSTDKTAEVAKKYKDRLSIRVIKEKKKGSGAARAAGFEAAKAPIVFSTDADTVVPPHWLETFMKYFQNDEVVAVTGPGRIDDPSRFNSTVVLFFQMLGMYTYRLFMGYMWLSGFSYAVRKDAYNKAGKIDTDLPSLDDMELATRLHKFGKITFLRDHIVFVSNRRFKGSPIVGLLSYVKPFFEIRFLKKKSIRMKDFR